MGAESSGATLVTLNNLYAYGKVTAPMTTDTPLSADYEKARVCKRMWTEALAAHESGRVRATEVRASDFIGPRAQEMFGLRVAPRILVGKSCQVLGSLDQPHSWTFVDDVARTLITCAQNSEAWSRAWNVSTNSPRTQREVIDNLADVAGVAHVKASVIPLPVLRLMGVFNPVVRELPKTLYQFTEPFVIDDELTRTVLGLELTPWRTVLQTTVDAYCGA